MTFADPGELVLSGLATKEFLLRPITAADAALDYAAVMETREQLRLWEQSSWPADDFTVEANREDLIGLEQRHAEHRAYTFTVLSPDASECFGCVYAFPIEATFLTKSEVTAVGVDIWEEIDAVVYFWTRLSQTAKGLDERLLAELRVWFSSEWKLEKTVFVTNEQFRQQVDVIERTDLLLKYELAEPGKAGKYLIFG